CLAVMCADEPYGAFEYGALEDLPRLDGRVLEERRRQLVAEAPIDVYVAGAVDRARAEELVREVLTTPRRGAAPLRGTTPHPAPRPPREVREQMSGLNQT